MRLSLSIFRIQIKDNHKEPGDSVCARAAARERLHKCKLRNLGIAKQQHNTICQEHQNKTRDIAEENMNFMDKT